MSQVPTPPLPPVPPMFPGSDLGYLIHQVEPFIALILVFAGLRWLLRSPVGEAVAERIRARGAERWGGGARGGDRERTAALEAQVSQLQGQIAELGERLDFAERLLAERRERKLGAGQ